MNAGYVYILINPSMPGLLKIGKTLRDSRERARELGTTGVPTPFQLAFEIFSEQHDKLEASIHRELIDFRVAGNREFFRYPLAKAIQLLQQLDSPPTNKDSTFAAEDITDRLRRKYRLYLKPDIVSIRIVQPGDRVWLEVTEEKEIAGYLRDQTISRTDLGFISNGPYESPFFNPRDGVSINANRFVEEFDEYSIIHTTDIFHEKACAQIAAKHERHG
jgi:T5orf172 domain